MIMLFINLFLEDYIYRGQLIDNEKLFMCFQNLGPVVQSWIVMILYSYLIIILVQLIDKFKLKKNMVIINLIN